MTDASPIGGGPWLAEPDHPSLATAMAARLDDPALPDRLAWNTFRTLAAWNTDVWVPAMLETALGPANPLSGFEWGDARVEVWKTGRHLDAATDVVVDGRDAVVLVEATFLDDLTAEHLAEGADAALGLAGRRDRPAGYVLLGPGVDDAEAERLADTLGAGFVDLAPGEGHGLRPEALDRIAGWLTWADVGALLVDLAEESGPLQASQVRRIITELQERFPGIEV